jgi:hypothetical protein
LENGKLIIQVKDIQKGRQYFNFGGKAWSGQAGKWILNSEYRWICKRFEKSHFTGLFCIWCLVLMTQQNDMSSTIYSLTPKTKHQKRDEFYFLTSIYTALILLDLSTD